MNVSTELREAYFEIDYIIELLNDYDKNKIPAKLRKFFKREKSSQYGKNIDEVIKNKELSKETLSLVAFLNMKYICEDEIEKERLKNIYTQNEITYRRKQREKYNPDNLFKKRNDSHYTLLDFDTNKALVEVKEKHFLQKIFENIKNLF